jgi:hypothetical protein
LVKDPKLRRGEQKLSQKEASWDCYLPSTKSQVNEQSPSIPVVVVVVVAATTVAVVIVAIVAASRSCEVCSRGSTSCSTYSIVTVQDHP